MSYSSNVRTKILFKNGDTLEIPEIVSVGAGWVLRPDEARTSDEIRTGTNKSFGRSYDGEKKANRWLAEYLNDWMEDHNWPKPASTDKERYFGMMRTSGGMNITFKHPAHIFDQLSLHVREGYGSKAPSATFQWKTTALHRWMIMKHIAEDSVNPFTDAVIDEQTKAFNTREQAFQVAQAFSRDPIGTAAKYLNLADFPYTNEDLPPLTWPDSLSDDHMVWLEGDTISLYCNTDHAFYRDSKFAEKVFTDSYSEFDNLQKAFKHLGVEFRVRQSADYGNPSERRYYISEVKIQVPGVKGDEHNEKGHTITLGTDNITVVCGYRQDEKRWMEYEKRKAANWLQDMEELMTTTQPTKEDYEDYDYKPSN